MRTCAYRAAILVRPRPPPLYLLLLAYRAAILACALAHTCARARSVEAWTLTRR
jgi:hypothetical protein